MGVNRVKDKKNQVRREVRKRWPDGREFRRYYPNVNQARQKLAEIETSIFRGNWREVRDELKGVVKEEPKTVKEFSEEFLNRYAKPRLRSWNRYELSLKTLNEHLGNVFMTDLRRNHLHDYVERRLRSVSPGTVNKDISAIKKLFSYALETGVIDQHPLTRFPLVKVQETARRVLEPPDFRHLVDSMDRLEISVMTAVLGETGMRKAESLALRWDKNIRMSQGIITPDHTKNRKVRDVPLSDYAIQWLSKLVRRIDCPYVFVNPNTGRRWGNPEKPFKTGCKAAGLKWVGFHDLRRYRATQWLRLGVDVRTVKDLLGHADIQTTMRYALSIPDHAIRSVRQAEKLEIEELSQSERVKNG
jgi:integrase